MLKFLNFIFTRASVAKHDDLDDELISKAIDRAVEATDPRFRYLPNYRSRLRGSVATSARHVISLVDAIQPATALSRAAYSDDQRLRVFFASPDRLLQLIGKSPFVTDFLKTHKGYKPDMLFGLLSMERKERTEFGMGLENDRVVRDKKQVVVNFSNHRFSGISGNEDDTRWELKQRGFDFLLEMALTQIATARENRDKLSAERQILRRKLSVMQSGNWGLESTLSDVEAPASISMESLEREIAGIESTLDKLGSHDRHLEHGLETVCKVLRHPADWLAMRNIRSRIDNRGIKVSSNDPGSTPELEFTELYSDKGGLKRTCLLGYYPFEELPEKTNMFQEAARYLR